ncbi:hypothetical protein ACNKHS_15085 [Shigella flexneri]
MKADQEFDGLYNELLLEMARNQIFLINERQLSTISKTGCATISNIICASISPILIDRETDWCSS